MSRVHGRTPDGTLVEFALVDDDPAGVSLSPEFVGPRRMSELARTLPDRPFLIEVGGARFSYAQAHERMMQWVAYLALRGVGPGDHVASFLPPSADAVLIWFAASLLGACEVPINPDLRGEFLDHVVRDSRASLCVLRPDQLRELRTATQLPPTVIVDPKRDVLAGIAPATQGVMPLPGDASCVIYTSGTTGPSKGAIVTWAQIASFIGRTPRSLFTADDVAYAPWPMFHVTGRSPVIVMLDCAGSVVLRERFSLSSTWSDLVQHNVTYASLAQVIRLLVDHEDAPSPGGHSLRLVYGGDAATNLAFSERFGVEIFTSYGSTELGFPVVNRTYHRDSSTCAGWLRRGYDAKVVDSSGQEVPIGEVGELWVRPPAREMIFREYLGLPERTATAVVDGWYRTGDAIRLDATGGVHFVDRLSDTIRRFGENISSVAVQNAVSGLAEVELCAVIGVPSPITGQEVLLAVVLADGWHIEPAVLFERLQSILPRHALPAYITIVDALPTTPTGRVRKALLGDLTRDAWQSPVLRPSASKPRG